MVTQQKKSEKTKIAFFTVVFPKNEKQLTKAIKNAWKQIQISKIKNCIESMPRRLKLVLASKGNISKY